jgi:hypothetical protein
MPIQPNIPFAPRERAWISSEATIIRKAVSVGTLTNSDSSDPVTRTTPGRSGSRNMWYSEVGGTKTRYSANTILENRSPNTDFTPVSTRTSTYHISTVAIRGR